MPGPLADVKVLDFSTLLPGPMATLLLAEAGADVIKIERPDGGDPMRGYAPRWGDVGAAFALLNRGKKSLAVDLKDPAQRERLRPLLRQTDVLIEQFRPGVMTRLGLGYSQLRDLNPDIIYCSITGYGQTGPDAQRAGHDLNYLGDAGLLALSSGPAQRPTVPPALIADIAGGAYPAVINILLALRDRDRGGGGAQLDIAMTENLFPFAFWALGEGQTQGRWPGSGDALLSGGSARYRIYPTADGALVAAAPLEDKFWRAFCDVIGLDPALRDDARDPCASAAAVAALIAARPAGYWRDAFAAADCCCSVVRSLEQARAAPHFAARGVFDAELHNADGDRMAALPVPIASALRVAPNRPRAAPGLDDGRDDDG